MTDNFDDSIFTGDPPKKNNNTWIIVLVVVLVLLCCCCAAVFLVLNQLWIHGDQILESILALFGLAN